MKRTILLGLISTMCIITSCTMDDIFDRKPLDKISEADVWHETSMLRSYLSDIYSRMPFSTIRFNERINLDQVTDIATRNNGNIQAITTGDITRSSEPSLLVFWNYGLVRDVNIFIKNIAVSTISQVQKEQMEGEARVLRAILYHEMQKRYGGVPLVDEPIDPYGKIDEKYTKRSTEEAIADFIDNDLAKAIPLLSEDSQPTGMINKWTAYAVKARASLWSASIAKYGMVQLNGLVGIPSNRANEFYNKASDAANAIITSGRYELYQLEADKSENYRKLFGSHNNREVILACVYDGVNIFHRWNQSHLPLSYPSQYYAHEVPLYDYILKCENIDGSTDEPLIGPEYLYDDGFQAFENKDPRIKGTLIFPNETFEGVTSHTYEGIDPSPTPDPNSILSTWGQEYMGMPQVGLDSRLCQHIDRRTSTGFYVKKYCFDVEKRENRNPWIEYRLGEIYLTRAEAEFELGNMQAAADALNVTRARAGINSVTSATITRERIRTERMVEMAWEQHRWWDLRRWRTAEEVLNGKTFNGLRVIYHYTSGKFYFLPIAGETVSRTFRIEHYYNPITNSRIDNNPDLVENPGY